MVKERAKVYVLYGNQERVFNEFDRAENLLGAGSNPPTGTTKRIVQDIERELEPSESWPLSVVFDNQRMGLQADGCDSAPDRHVYAVPLFSHQVVQQLEGRLLDYVDATYADKEQRDSQKRVLRRVLWGFHEELTNMRKAQFEHSKLAEN